MSDSTIRDQFFDLWSNRLSDEVAQAIQAQIESDPELKRQYEEDCILFTSLMELGSESIEVPELFSERIVEAIDRRRLNVFWSKVMSVLRLSRGLFGGIGWTSLAALCVALAVLGFLHQIGRIHIESVLNFIEGRGGVYLFIFFVTYAVLSLPVKYFRLAALTGTVALALFVVRTSISTFFVTESFENFSGGPAQSSIKNEGVITAKIKPQAVAGAPALEQEGKFVGDLRQMTGALPAQGIVSSAREMIGVDEPSLPMQENRESYGHEDQNSRVSVSSQPVSTFSIDVDTGSYSNIRRMIRSGQVPPKDAVRIEELVNYFPYSYSDPKNKPFDPNFEIAPSPLNPGRYLLRVGLKAAPAVKDQSKGWNLVFLVDTSGSMDEPNKLPLVKQSLELLTDSMRPEDRISIVTYAGTAGVALPSTSGSEKAKIRSVIQSLGAGGSTNGSGGIEAAYAQAIQNKIEGSVNRVILATDGDFNVGISNFNGLMELIENKRRSGVTLTTLGFGTGNYQEHSMEQLADKGDGNYFYIDSFQEARKVLASELTQAMEVVAKDVKIQIEFNPEQVSEYRLVGFDNRILANEDFVNDRVDAGEIGSGHTVTAFYEIALTSRPISGVGQELRYKRESSTAVVPALSGELAFLKIRAKKPQGGDSIEYTFPVEASLVKGALTEASQDFKFASAVVGYGELLRNSKYSGSITWQEVRKLALEGRGEDPFGYRSEFLGLVDAASSLKK